MLSEAVVAKFATTECRSSSPSEKIFFMCLDMVDLFLSNRSESWSKDNHTVSSSGEILTSSSNYSSLKVTMLVISEIPFPITKGDDL